MKAFQCRMCESSLYFGNSRCISCSTELAWSRAEQTIVPLDGDGCYTDLTGTSWWRCRNLDLHGCTWLTEEAGADCFACRLTRRTPDLDDPDALAGYRSAERAKRQLVAELDARGLPIGEELAFDLLHGPTSDEKVVIGHADGVITLDVAESDDAVRAKVRVRLDEPYRTMLGHFRHEIGHYYEWQLVRGDLIEQCRELFGDETADYQKAIDRHYAEGPPDDWADSFLSTYATMHPFEDFAETFAHFLHISDTIGTAAAYGLTTVQPEAFSSFRDLVVGVWLPLSASLNQINRSMGRNDLYPFVIPPPVLDKLDFVAKLVQPE